MLKNWSLRKINILIINLLKPIFNQNWYSQTWLWNLKKKKRHHWYILIHLWPAFNDLMQCIEQIVLQGATRVVLCITREKLKKICFEYSLGKHFKTDYTAQEGEHWKKLKNLRKSRCSWTGFQVLQRKMSH